jgi:hypothetical protein
MENASPKRWSCFAAWNGAWLICEAMMSRRIDPGADRSVHANLSRVDVGKVLDRILSVTGVCLCPDAEEALMAAPPASAREFVDAFYRHQGIEPTVVGMTSYRHMLVLVSEEFARVAECQSSDDEV